MKARSIHPHAGFGERLRRRSEAGAAREVRSEAEPEERGEVFEWGK